MSYTLLGIDRDAGLIGVATASYSLAVGNAVPALNPAAGVVASQAWTNRLLRHLVLDEVASGATAPQALGRIGGWDDGEQFRQVAAIGADGTIAWVTGTACSPWAGGRAGADHVAIGNLLTGPEVLDAMCTVFSGGSAGAATSQAGEQAVHTGADGVVHGVTPDPGEAPPWHAAELSGGSDATLVGVVSGSVGTFAHRLVAALIAGERAGGDARGKQSAAVLVANLQQAHLYPPELVVDLRVDDSREPTEDLAGLVRLRLTELAQPSTGRPAPTTTA